MHVLPVARKNGVVSFRLLFKFSCQNQSAANTFELHEKEVANVMESILTKVSEEADRKKTAYSDTKKSANRRGQATRKAYTNEFKYKIICEANMSSFNGIDVAQKSMVSINFCSLSGKKMRITSKMLLPKNMRLLK